MASGFVPSLFFIKSHPRRSHLPDDGLSVQLSSVDRSSLQLVKAYGTAILTVALSSLCIGIVKVWAPVDNLSLVYLVAVLWLAVRLGRGPAILAAFLAFLAYDCFFVPPVGGLLPIDPTQWISLVALLAVALVIGQLTATIQAQVSLVQMSQHRTVQLYELSQHIAASPDQTTLFHMLLLHVVQVFGSAGVTACALVLSDEHQQPQIQAVAPSSETALDVFQRTRVPLAERVLQQGVLASLFTGTGGEEEPSDSTIFYIPLFTGQQVIGALGIVGTYKLYQLVSRIPSLDARQSTGSQKMASADPEAAFFATFCDQFALALKRVTLEQEAIQLGALRESDRLKNVLLGSVTHDLRTPLASIKAATTSLLEPGMVQYEEDRSQLVRTIDVSADRLSHLVRNLLDFSRLEGGVGAPEPDWHFLGDVVAPVLDQLELAGYLRHHQIVVDLPDSLPPVSLDHGQIGRVLLNLLENALKFSPTGSMIRVQARVTGTPPELEVRVCDQGIGIAAHELTAIFEKFYQGKHPPLPWGTTPSPSSIGLGLTICSAIIQAHHGRIWAESQPGEGAMFIFTLPLPADSPLGELPELNLASA
jgi:two-component system, OmpR family, sensor histidine kinase KdpD